jgi:hypothetical protein
MRSTELRRRAVAALAGALVAGVAAEAPAEVATWVCLAPARQQELRPVVLERAQ